MSSSLVGSSSSGGGGVERERATNRLQRWQCGGSLLIKREAGAFHWAKPSICNFTLHSSSLSSLACLASGCSVALYSWRSVTSLVCLTTGCSAALRTRCLSSLASLTLVCSNLCSWSLWRRRCSLAVALPLAQDPICLLHSVDSSALSYMMRSPLSHSVDSSALSYMMRSPLSHSVDPSALS